MLIPMMSEKIFNTGIVVCGVDKNDTYHFTPDSVKMKTKSMSNCALFLIKFEKNIILRLFHIKMIAMNMWGKYR